jgi:molybdate transport system substrate-binding protein
MRRKRSVCARRSLLAALVLLAPVGCGKDEAGRPAGEVVLYAAASLGRSCDALARAFEKEHPSVRVVTSFGASGALARQLVAAPRADVFVSANDEYMTEVERSGRVVPGTRRALLENQLVAVVARSSPLAASTPAALAELPFRRLFVADPDQVPAGKYAKSWLSSQQLGASNVWDALAAKRVPVADVRAALAQAEASSDAIAIVYRTDALSSDRVKVLFERKETAGIPIRYPVARIARPDASAWSQAFYEFLLGPAARAEFRAAGFRVIGD